MQVKNRKRQAWYKLNMKRILIVYYSRTGYTRRVAEELAALADAELQPITEDRSRMGIAGFFRSATEAYLVRPAKINPSQHTPENYDLVIFGTPVWAGRISSPMLGYLKTYKPQVDRYAVFCTVGGSDGAVALDQFAEIIGKQPDAELILTDKEIDAGTHKLLIETFAEHLNGSNSGQGNVEA